MTSTNLSPFVRRTLYHRLLRASLLIALVGLFALPIFLGVWHWSGPVALQAAVISWLACVGGAVTGQMIAPPVTSHENVMVGVWSGMFARLGLPIATVLAMFLLRQDLLVAGAGYYLVIFYLATLAVDRGTVLWSLASISPSVGRISS
jgi:hypothetical protein